MFLLKLQLRTFACLLAVLFLTACNNTGTKANFDDVDAQVSDNAFEQSSATDTTLQSSSANSTQTTIGTDSANTSDVVEETQAVGRAVLASVEDSTSSDMLGTLEIVDTDKGDWLKTPKGYKLKLKETGDYICSDVIEAGDNLYYFDENGYLQTSLFVSSNGKDWYVQNCKKVYGFIEIAGSTYYIDVEKGVLKACSAKIDGETYWFNRDGETVTESEFNKLSESNEQE